MAKQPLYCDENSCSFAEAPAAAIDPSIFDPKSPNYNPLYGIPIPNAVPTSLPTFPTTEQQQVVDIMDARLQDTIDNDPYTEIVWPPLSDMLDSLAEELPLPTQAKADFIAAKNAIIDQETGSSGGGGGGSTSYTAESLYASIIFVLPSFSLFISLTIMIPFMGLIAAAIAGVSLLVLFNQTIAGIDVLVDLGLSEIVKLLASLIPLCFSAAFALTLVLPMIGFAFGVNISISFAVVLAAFSFSFAFSLGIGFNLSIIGGEAGKTLIEATTPATPGGPPPGAPTCEKGILLAQEIGAPLSQVGNFGESFKPASMKDLSSQSYDTETKINIVPASGTYTPIRHSVVNPSVNPNRPMSLREAVNRCSVEEDAALYLFEHLGLPLNTKITLTELLFRSAGFPASTPLDATILPIIKMNLPSAVSLHTHYILVSMSGKIPECPILTKP